MIPVTPAREPADFDEKVRQKGLAAIDELLGKKPRRSRPGPRRKKIANQPEEIPPDAFPPLWRDALGDMLCAYKRRCAYLALYIEHATGSPTVDHVAPKSHAWNQVYEWSNYRLCAALINAKKKDLMGVLDPFEIKEGWFALDLCGFQVVVGPGAPEDRVADIKKNHRGPRPESARLPQGARGIRRRVQERAHQAPISRTPGALRGVRTPAPGPTSTRRSGRRACASERWSVHKKERSLM